MSIFFTSDQHFGHKAVISHANRPYGSAREMDDEMIANWNRVVTAKDTVYHLGDFGLSNPGHLAGILKKLRGTIHLVKGNHDKPKSTLNHRCIDRFASIQSVMELYVSDHTAPKGKRLIYLHHYACRTWPKKHWGSWHLYGHSHGKLEDLPDHLSFDVGVDCWDFTPISYPQARSRMAQKTWRRLLKPRKR